MCSPVRWTSLAGVQIGWISSAQALITSATTNTGMVLFVSLFHPAFHGKPLTSMQGQDTKPLEACSRLPSHLSLGTPIDWISSALVLTAQRIIIPGTVSVRILRFHFASFESLASCRKFDCLFCLSVSQALVYSDF